MSDLKRCKNYENPEIECPHYLELDQPKHARYCRICGPQRSKQWKKENPEKLQDYSELSQQWREARDWPKYMRDRRKANILENRAQNLADVQRHRGLPKERKKSVTPKRNFERQADLSDTNDINREKLSATMSQVFLLSFLVLIITPETKARVPLAAFTLLLLSVLRLLRAQEMGRL